MKDVFQYLTGFFCVVNIMMGSAYLWLHSCDCQGRSARACRACPRPDEGVAGAEWYKGNVPEPVTDDALREAALQAAADVHGGYMNATKKRAVIAAINVITHAMKGQGK